jgi:nicotinate-nucleotide pyrophosphorylase (carboxylating)
VIETFQLKKLIDAALEEDIGPGDLTTKAVLDGSERGKAAALAKSALVVAGIDVFKAAFLFIDESLSFSGNFRDGQAAEKGSVLAEISGSLSSILRAERVALNFFQRMCGIATATRSFVDAVKGTRAVIVDTRKTVPGLRVLDKYAVAAGGGRNHRFGLYDGVLIKDNHIEAAGGISAAVSRARQHVPHTVKIEVEAKNIDEVREALSAGTDIIMLDNMGIAQMKQAVSLIAGKALVEASGNIALANVREVALTGVDIISTGALTHSVKAADISLLVIKT